MKQQVTKQLITAVLPLLVAGPALLCAANTGATSTSANNQVVVQVASTVPPNGDLNPYGVAVVQRTSGKLIAGDILVSNFNNKANLQGTGTTIMDIAPNGTAHPFASIDASTLPGQCPGGVGLTSALVVLRAGWVIVGSLPTTDGTAATAQAGCLLVLNNQGEVVETITNILINGPWGMTALDQDATANIFVTNVLNGTVAGNGSEVWGGTVVRINTLQSPTMMPTVQSMTPIGNGFAERTDPAALVIGPTGVALAADGSLYVADTLNNRIVSIGDAVNRSSSALNGQTLSNAAVLNAPLGIAVRPNNGHVLAVNANDGMLVELTARGQVVSSGMLDNQGNPPGAGTLFGLATGSAGLYFVNDGTNTLNLLANPL